MTTAAQRKRGLQDCFTASLSTHNPEIRGITKYPFISVIFVILLLLLMEYWVVLYIVYTMRTHEKWNLILRVCPWIWYNSKPTEHHEGESHYSAPVSKNHSAPWQYSQQTLSWHIKLALRTKSKSFWSPTAATHQFKPHYVLVPVIIPPHSLCWKRNQAE